ncbi:hypothetical protein OH77DRAFT_1429381 [Trametes cingulata]|nr:hypothetical protein OH77DRAFT_1429381 [Trametes cingulata]
MELLDLPTDVLLLVFSHIYGQDALNVALTSKQLVDLALPRVAAVIECWGPSMLRRLHAYMLSSANTRPDVPLRAVHLRKLTLDVCIFFDGKGSTLQIPDVAVVSSDQYFRRDFSGARLIGDLLVNAPNLRELHFNWFEPCMTQDPRIGSALCSMTSLRKLTLRTLGDSTVNLLSACPSDIRHLGLSYCLPHGSFVQNDSKTFPVLLNALASFRNLRILELWTFSPPESFSTNFTPPHFPSITYLRLSDSSPLALDMVALCPNLSTLIYSGWEVMAASLPRSGLPWPPLKRLLLEEHEYVPDVLGRLSRVERLHIGGQLPVPVDDDQDMAHLLELVHIASPVELYLCLLVESTPVTYWSQIAPNAPRLRVVEVKVEIPSPELQYDGWLDDLPHALRPLSVPCLRVYLPCLRHASVIWPDARPNPAGQMARRAAAREMELRRAESVRTLPQRLADALPSLRYLALLDDGPNEYNLRGNRNEVVAERIGNDDHNKWDELRRVECVKSHKWWRIVGSADARTLEPISVEEGEQAQEELMRSVQ